MQRFKRAFAVLGFAVALTASPAFAPSASAETYPSEKDCSSIENPTIAQQGWCVAVNRRKGNCLSCHVIVVNPWPEGFPPGGNIAPPLVAMKQRFPDREKLRAQIYDASAVVPGSRMPPFGKHRIISAAEIDAIVEFLLTI